MKMKMKMKMRVMVVLVWCLIEMVQSNDQTWQEQLGLGLEKVTKLHFYFHDTLSGKKPSAVAVAKAAQTNESPTEFGLLMMADDPLTEGPEATSKVVGRAQGTYGSAGQEEMDLIMAMTYWFTEEPYKGSTLSILGRNAAMNRVREMPIVGGTGFFKLSRGIATAKTYWLNYTNGDAIVEYNVTVIHYGLISGHGYII